MLLFIRCPVSGIRYPVPVSRFPFPDCIGTWFFVPDTGHRTPDTGYRIPDTGYLPRMSLTSFARGSYDLSTTRSLSGIIALSVIVMFSGQTLVQHFVMLQ